MNDFNSGVRNLADYQIFCIYIFFHNILTLNNDKVIYNNDELINNNRYIKNMFYASLIYYLVWGFFDLGVTFVTYQPSEQKHVKRFAYTSSYALPYILVYNNVFFIFNSEMSYGLYLQYHKISWLFTAPYIIYIYANIYNINKRYPIYNEILLHSINVFNIFNDSYLTLSNILMYCLYFYNLYLFSTYKFPVNIMLLYSWFVVGFVETLYLFQKLNDDTYIIFLVLNDIQVKVFVFIINAFKYWQVSYISNIVNMHDTKILYTIQKNLDKLQTDELRHYFGLDLLLNYVDHNNETITSLKTLGGSQRYSHDFVLDLVKKDYKQVENVVILFSDIVNYSGFSMNNKPGYVITFLQKLYSIYDSLVQKYDMLQKIENVGDCYMVTSNLSKMSESKLSDKELMQMCEQMFQFARDITMLTNKIKMDTRIGVNIGNVSIGIVGNEIPRICVVGHEVNYTARLESTCQFNCIQVSENFHMVISSVVSEDMTYDCLYVHMKNIGEQKTYLYKGPFSFDSEFLNYHSTEIARLMSMVKKSTNLIRKVSTEKIRRHTYSDPYEFKKYSTDRIRNSVDSCTNSSFCSRMGTEHTDDVEVFSYSDVTENSVSRSNSFTTQTLGDSGQTIQPSTSCNELKKC